MDSVPGRSRHRRLHARATHRSCRSPVWSTRSSGPRCRRTRTGSPTSSARTSRARSSPRRCSDRTGIDYRPEDIALTTGAFGGLGVTIRALCDERRRGHLPVAAVVLLRADDRVGRRDRRSASGSRRPSSTWIPRRSPRRSRRVPGRSSSTARTTRPAGSTVEPSSPRSAMCCAQASERHGRPIVLISDESYNRIVFDGIDFRSPALDYDATITIYTYGKTLLAPGQRIGYVALTPDVPRPDGDRLPDPRPAARRRLGLPERAAPARDRRPRGAVDRHRRAPGAARPDGPGAARDGLRGRPSPRARST